MTVSKSTVGRWLKVAALKPHRVQRWLHSPDPDFRRKVRRVVRWYLRRRRGLRVLCVDEKTQVQILDRLHPGRPMRPGHPERLDDQYRRHGTLAVLAGWDVRTGRVVALVRRRRRGQEFLQLLRRLRRAWVAAQDGRVRCEFLPLHASWLNQVEVWFSILERQALVRASDATYEARAERIARFIRHWNRTARPFRWTFKGYPLHR